MSEREAQREILDAAIELHARDESRRDFDPPKGGTKDAVRTLEEAAAELGISPEYLIRAQAEVARRQAEAAQAQARRKTWRNRILGVLAALAVGVTVWQVATPAPAEPWADQIENRSHWGLETSPGTRATLRFESDATRGQVAVAEVDQVAARADGSWFVNLDARGLPSLERHEFLVVELSGTLPSARIYLESGTDERWRSPPITVSADFARHRLPLRTFEHQRRSGGTWRVVDYEAPEQADVISIKLGHFVNTPEARGLVRVAEVAAE